MNFSESRHILFVLGMHRAGTSALCAALQACGGRFGGSLLAPMSGVNDEGFWEDSGVVELNDRLLQQLGAQWYRVASPLLDQDWQAPTLQVYREEARAILGRGFGGGPLEVIKDPRLCITFPLWQSVCADMGVETSVCVISRAPIEIACSLQKRDEFPLGYGLRLASVYRRAIARNAPSDALHLDYRQLLQDPVGTMQGLSAALPLSPLTPALASAIRRDLWHQQAGDVPGLLFEADTGDIDDDALDAEIEAAYPPQQTLHALAEVLVARGVELTRLGAAHSAALATLDQRDQEQNQLAQEHRLALATIAERDQQIGDFDLRLTETGAHLGKALDTLNERDRQIDELGQLHTHALDTLRQRDEQLRRVLNIPGMGVLFRAIWKHAAR